MDGYGLVLAGGGTRGSYEIGVWKALRKLNTKIVAVTGTSVGALNGAAIVQDDFEVAYSMWESLAIKDVLNFQQEIDSIADLYKYPKDIIPAITNAIASRGLDTSPLVKLVDDIIDEEKIRSSPIDFGLVTFSLTDFKSVEIFKEDIPKGQLRDYLLASACLPSFQPVEIDDKRFIDGGLYNNVPISLMMRKNIKNLIIVDISNDGLPKKLDLSDYNIIHIVPSENIGGILDFDKEQLKLNIKLGYLDTLKAFGKVHGNNYYIKGLPDKDTKDFKINTTHLKGIYSILGIDYNEPPTPISKHIINKVYNNITKHMIEEVLKNKGSRAALIAAMSEITATQFKIDNKKIYSFEELNEIILNKYNNFLDMNQFDEYIENLFLSISNIRGSDIINVIKNIPTTLELLPALLADPMLEGENIGRLRRVVAITFPNISISSIYIYLLMQNLNLNKSHKK